MGDGTEQNPLTRDDVLRLIKENGGKTEGLDLSQKVFEISINLSYLDLRGIILDGADLAGEYSWPELGSPSASLSDSQELKGAHFEGAILIDASFKNAMLADVHFERADLSHAHLENACLWDAHLENAKLITSHLEETDLSNAKLEGSQFIGAHLEKATLSEALIKEAILIEAHLEEANLYSADLEGADLARSNLEGASLNNTNLKGADLTASNLIGAHLEDTKFNNDTKLEGVNWGNYILPEESDRWFYGAQEIYRKLKILNTNAGMYDIAGKFFFREMTVRRKAMEWWPNPFNKAFSKLITILCGYGEKPERVVVSALVIIFGLAIAYHLFGSFNTFSFWDKLYYSAISFTAVGYGNWAPQPTGWAKGMGAIEAFIGVFMMALFLVTFTRKMTR